MYVVQVYAMPGPVSTTSTPHPHWVDHSLVDQMEDEITELGEARAVARILSTFYHEVRIAKYSPGGDSFKVVS